MHKTKKGDLLEKFKSKIIVPAFMTLIDIKLILYSSHQSIPTMSQERDRLIRQHNWIVCRDLSIEIIHFNNLFKVIIKIKKNSVQRLAISLLNQN